MEVYNDRLISTGFLLHTQLTVIVSLKKLYQNYHVSPFKEVWHNGSIKKITRLTGSIVELTSIA